MIDLAYSLNIEATGEPDFFGFFSPDPEGFTGVGHSLEDCLYQAKHGMLEHVQVLRDLGRTVGLGSPSPLGFPEARAARTIQESVMEDDNNPATKADIRRLESHLDRLEANLLTEFHKWAQTDEVRARGTTRAVHEFDERLGLIEERVSRLERGGRT